MAELPLSGLPDWVIQPGGVREPFEPDKISSALYAAGVGLGRPDAFSARELTDGVLHFLAQEPASISPTTDQIAELVVKVVRELGHPDLAKAFELRRSERRPQQPETHTDAHLVPFRFSTKSEPGAVMRDSLRAYSLHAIYSRDLRAANEEGFIALGSLTTPEHMACAIADNPGPDFPPAMWIHALNQTPASTILFDSPEWAWPDILNADKLHSQLSERLLLTPLLQRALIFNVHCDSATSGSQTDESPLFHAEPPRSRENSCDLAGRFLAACQRLSYDAPRIRVHWHIRELDFAPDNRTALRRVLGNAMEHETISFFLDRPRQPIHLSSGADRHRPAVLLEVGLCLPRLLDHVDGALERLLAKLPSLARMGVRAAVQRRNYFRRRCSDDNRLVRGFLLDRARLLVFPVGLDAIVHRLLGQGMSQSKLSFDLGKQIVEILWATLSVESRSAHLDIAFDSPINSEDFRGASAENIAGLRCGPYPASWRHRLQVEMSLQVSNRPGTITMCRDSVPAADELADLLQAALKKNTLASLQFESPNLTR